MNPHNDDDDEHDEIRVPDKVFYDQLLPDIPEDDMSRALRISMEENNEMIKRQYEYESCVIESYTEEKKRRESQFCDLLFALNKLSNYDPTAHEVYQLLFHIIEHYCEQTIQTITLDELTYNKIFNFLRTVRTNSDHLTSLILKE